MTFQISDTNLKPANIRQTALRHAVLSDGTLIIATTINLVAGLTTQSRRVRQRARVIPRQQPFTEEPSWRRCDRALIAVGAVETPTNSDCQESPQ
jgi:hypothetical protein